MEDNTIWCNLLSYRYHNLTVKMYVNDRRGISKGDSLWWRDLTTINDCKGSKGLSISDMFYCRVKNGEHLSFWFRRWAGNQSISKAFPELYIKAISRFTSVAEAGYWVGLEWLWDNNDWLKE